MSRPAVIVKKGPRARAGSPWIFANEIRMEQVKALPPGTLVNVRGDDGRDLGTGLFNAKSLIAVRISPGNFCPASSAVVGNQVP